MLAIVYKVDFNITIIDYKGTIVAMQNKSSHTASSQKLVNYRWLIESTIYAPSICLKDAIYHSLLLF